MSDMFLRSQKATDNQTIIKVMHQYFKCNMSHYDDLFICLLYPHFLKKVRVYCCYPFLSVRPTFRKKSLSLELRLHFKDLRIDTLGSHWVCPVDAQ